MNAMHKNAHQKAEEYHEFAALTCRTAAGAAVKMLPDPAVRNLQGKSTPTQGRS
jgi:hypothetical protein